MNRVIKLHEILLLGLAASIWLAPAPVFADDNLQLGNKLYSIGELRDPAYLDYLLSNLKSHDPHIRRIATHALGKIGDTQAAFPLMILAADENQPVMVRCCAIRALGKLDQNQAKQYLRGFCENPKRAIRKAASNTLQLIAYNQKNAKR